MQQHIAHWGVGINLGNSLDCFRGGAMDSDATDYETLWQNPKTTREMIHMYAEAGFDILRLPTTWGAHIGPAPDYAVDPAWMDRVEEIVTWAMEEGLRVILDTHHENNWLRCELASIADVLPRFAALWQQIAQRFNKFGEKLVFQGLNEPRIEGGENEWWGCTPDVRAALNVLNHTFVKVVRATGGNNATRWLCIPTAAAKPHPDALKDMILPKDDHIIVTVHSYTPAVFAFNHNPETSTPYFTKEMEQGLYEDFDNIAAFQQATGAAVMITEYGAVVKTLPDGSTNDEERARYETCFLTRAKEMGIPAVLWDNNYYTAGDEFFGLFDRRTLTCNTPCVMEAIRAFRTGK